LRDSNLAIRNSGTIGTKAVFFFGGKYMGCSVLSPYGTANMTRACLHLGVHEHPIKVGEDHEIKDRTRKVIEDHVERTPKATNSAIVMEASKKLVGELLINPEGALVSQHRIKYFPTMLQILL
jgi:hypothetical protein